MYSTSVPEISNNPVEFGTSGLLYRSNKLMYDRTTHTLWRQFTGEPVAGRLAESGIRLKTIPLTLTTWAEWLETHPDTTVLDVHTRSYPPDTYYSEDDPNSIYYRYFGSPSTLFPVWLESNALPLKEQVLGVLAGSVPKAYRLEDLRRAMVVNDEVASVEIVLVAPPQGRGAQAYLRRGVTFTGVATLEGVERRLWDAEGRAWRVTDEALVLEADPTMMLPRIPGYVSFWFAWYSNYPNTLLQGERPTTS